MSNPVKHLTASDPILKSLIDTLGPFEIEYHPPTFQTLVRSIVFQQLSGNVARVIYGRLETAINRDSLTPDSILKLRPERMRKIGLSAQKTTYIRDLASKTKSGEIVFESLTSASDQEVIDTLVQVKGVGVWTSHMFLIFALQRPDVLPIGDLGVRKAIQRAYNLAELPKPDEMEKIAQPWRPHCSAASWYLWRSLDGKAAI